MLASILRLSLFAAFFLPALVMAYDRPITIDDLLTLDSVGNPQVSPDGHWVAYTVSSRDFEEDSVGHKFGWYQRMVESRFQ